MIILFAKTANVTIDIMIIIGSDHSGFKYKKAITDNLKDLGYEIEDIGTFSDEGVDYPDIAKEVCDKLKDSDDYGILICGTGIGISIAANRHKHIRAALCTSSYEARMSKEHNNANVLCLGERVIGLEAALDIVNTWLKSEFLPEERHVRRVGKLK